MYKLIIADDDEILLEGLTLGIPWNTLDIEVVASLNDGIHIEEKIQETHADFLLTDIRMSQMDGLEVLKRIHQKNPDFPVIMLSAYEEFSYVQQALKGGALDYLLKPIDLKQLYEVIEKTKNILSQKHENFSYRQNAFFTRCLQHTADLKESYNEFIFAADDDWCVTEIHTNCPDKMAFLKALKEYAFQQGHVFLDYSQTEHLILLHHETDLPKEISEFQEGCRTLADSFQNTHLFFINGTIEKGIENLYLSMESVQRLRSYQFSEGNFTDLSEQSIQKYKNHSHSLNTALIDNFIKITSMGKSELINEYADKIKENLRQAGSSSLLFLSYVTGSIYDGIREKLCWNDFDEQYFDSMYTKVLSAQSLDEAIATITVGAQKISERVSLETYITSKNMIHMACAYVDENYGNSELRVTDVAKYVGLSPNYFSKVFAEEMNTSFTDYLIAKRLKEAQTLLLYTSYTSSEIAERVGYPNASYFSNIFKKYTGVTVSQYKKNINNDSMA